LNDTNDDDLWTFDSDEHDVTADWNGSYTRAECGPRLRAFREVT